MLPSVKGIKSKEGVDQRQRGLRTYSPSCGHVMAAGANSEAS